MKKILIFNNFDFFHHVLKALILWHRSSWEKEFYRINSFLNYSHSNSHLTIISIHNFGTNLNLLRIFSSVSGQSCSSISSLVSYNKNLFSPFHHSCIFFCIKSYHLGSTREILWPTFGILVPFLSIKFIKYLKHGNYS